MPVRESPHVVSSASPQGNVFGEAKIMTAL
jgi:hypothetical protein